MDLLLVEDKDSFRRLLVEALDGSGWSVRAAADPKEALAALEERPFEALVTDLRLPGMSGLELIRRARHLRPGIRVVLMSAFGEPRDIVEAMRLGADDFLPKPFDLDAFLAVLERLRALVGAPPPDPTEPWVAHSPAMQVLEAALRKAAAVQVPVIFRGEPGTGRERSARRLHALRHPTAPFRTMAAATLGPEGLDPALLALLEGGSLFLANLEHLGGEAAVALARSLETPQGRRVDFMGSFPGTGATALTLRLGALELKVPPLAERREDILSLARQHLERLARREGRAMPWLEREAERQLLGHAWPGQVRELETLLSRTLLLGDSPAIRSFPDLALGRSAPLCLPWPEPGPLEAMTRAVTRAAERQLLLRALSQANGELPVAAEALGLSLRTLTLRLRDQGISLEDGT